MTTTPNAPWQAAAAKAATDCQALTQPECSIPTSQSSKNVFAALRDPTSVLKVNKWDAMILDNELMALLKQPLSNMFAMFAPATMEKIKPELDTALSALLFFFSTGSRRPTPGMKLENVQYAPKSLSNKRITAFFLLSVALPYVWKRMMRHISTSHWEATTDATAEPKRTRLLALMKKLETFVLGCQLLNLLVFLRTGSFRSLVERVLGLRLESMAPMTMPRAINFEYMLRQLLWDGLMEFGNFVLPYLAWTRLRAPSSLFTANNTSTTTTIPSGCALCGMSPPQTPYITSCKHVYCYYCLQTAVAQEEDFACVACGVRFDSSQRLRA